MKQLLPILNDFEVVEAKDKKFILKHPNGKTVNTIIKEKLSEPSDTAVPREIQGEEADGQFNYDRVHIAALVPDKPDLLQEVVILHTESPQQIFVCPKNQIGLAETLVGKCEEYANIDKKICYTLNRINYIYLSSIHIKFPKRIIDRIKYKYKRPKRYDWNSKKEEAYLEQLRLLNQKLDKISEKLEKVEVEGVLLPKKLLNKDSNRSCPVCNTYSFDTRDNVYMTKYIS